ncbi:MAG: DinB family protein [Pseudomonadota bacterium]
MRSHHQPVNRHCPWSGDPVAANATASYRGHLVGFCNPDCRDKFASATAHFDQCLDEHPTPWHTYATYNQWFNQRLIDALRTLSPTQLWRDLGAVFGSIGVTLNHIMVWDLTWLRRIAADSAELPSLRVLDDFAVPSSHTDVLFADLERYGEARAVLDDALITFVSEVVAQGVDRPLRYRTQDGTTFSKPLAGVLQHMFNHQTHHRGQVTALLHQQGVDCGVTDLLAVLPDV